MNRLDDAHVTSAFRLNGSELIPLVAVHGRLSCFNFDSSSQFALEVEPNVLSSLKNCLLQTANSWAIAGVLFGGRIRLGYLSKQLSYRDEVREKNVIVN